MGDQSSDKVLRIGVIQGGRILDERLLRRRAPVTVGSDSKNTFVLAAGELPRSFKLLDVVRDRYLLCFDDEMRGRLTIEGESLDFETIKARGLALQTGSGYRVELSESARGRVVLGDLTFLFQFVVPPAPHVQSQLPTLVRGGWSTALDWPLLLCIGVSLVVHGTVLASLRTVEGAPASAFLELPAPAARFVASAPTPDEDAAGGGQRRGILRIIGATGPAAGDGAIVDLLAAGGRSGDLDAVLQHLAGVGLVGERSDLPPAADSQPALGAAFLGAATASSRMAGEVAAEEPEIVDGSLAPDAAAAAVRPRLGAVRWCYSEALGRNPQLRGRVAVSVVLDAEGRVTDSRVDANTLGEEEAGHCVATVLERARFPAPGPGGAQLLFGYSFAP
ncbi:MAG: AgmX/PglI C-terminal domain-containing protein [Deltaproteobacteria bacterium]|nr:AgmX/PglI C-terminal domain-containing protein [Deltaproteobacteria bacterium]